MEAKAIRKLSMEELGRLTVDEFKQTAKIPITVVLDDIRSMHNVGSVFRTADAFLVERILLCGFTPQPPHRDIHKTALGATETVAWQHFTRPEEAIAFLKEGGYRIYAVEQTTNSLPLTQMEWDAKEPLALVFGNEVSGVGDAFLNAADRSVEIPQMGMKHSLNISVAAGIVLYKFAEIFFKEDRGAQ